MKNLSYVLSSNSLPAKLLLLFSFIFAGIIAASGQGNTIVRQTDSAKGAVFSVKKYVEIPEATEPCDPAVCEWWKQLRQAGNDLQLKGNEKSKRKFILLFIEGLEKSYSVPIKDRSPQVLASERVEIGDIMKVRKLNGEVELSIEYKSDGSIGEIKVIKGLGSTIDNRVIQATRQHIFLPAVKDGVFVNDWIKGGLKISTKRE